MDRGPRAILLIVALTSALLGVFAAIHDHQDHDSSVPCSICLAAHQADDALPPAPPVFAASVPLPAPVARAFALVLAVRPSAVVVPPGRAPPHAS